MNGALVSVAGFLVLAAVAIWLEWRGRTRARSATVGAALAATMRTAGGRVVVFSCWLWVGVHFLAR